MKKLFSFLLPIFAAVLFFTNNVSAQNVQNFVIDDFSASYVLSKNENNVGQLDVTETITAVFPNYDQNHGIERAIPKSYKNSSLGLEVKSVTKEDGQSWNYTTRTQNDNLILRIGDADRYVRGEQTYVIKYTVSNVITFFNDHDELFWDINGDQWKQVTNNVNAFIKIDPSLYDRLIPEKEICYTGSFGSTTSDCGIDVVSGVSDITVYVSTTKQLSPGETLSIAIGFQPGTFSKPPTNWFALITKIVLISSALLLPIITGLMMIRRWQKSGRDSKGRGVIVPEYAPPKNMNPVLAEMILKERTSTAAVSSSIIELAISGYLKIVVEEKKKFLGKNEEFEIELVKKPTGLPKEVETVYSALFSGNKPGDKINLTSQKNKLYTKMKSINKSAEESATEKGYYLLTPTKARQKYGLQAVMLFAIGFGLFFFTIFFKQLWFLPLSLSASFSASIILIVGNFMPAKTPEGVALKEQLLGLEDYMKLAEADRIKTLQSPQGAERTPVDTKNEKEVLKLYERLLPYATLFGIEKDWAKTLAPLYQQPPDWVSSNNAFNAVMFSHAISGLQTSTAQSFAAPSSSGSSGFSGGGAGGGGGGGGGGGW